MFWLNQKSEEERKRSEIVGSEVCLCIYRFGPGESDPKRTRSLTLSTYLATIILSSNFHI